MARSSAFLDSMVDGILYDGLKDQLQDIDAANFRGDMQSVFEFVLVTDMLNLQVATDMLDFIIQRDDVIPFAESDSE
ncbi:hypothetical protein D3C81_1815790 [compost metagenome]